MGKTSKTKGKVGEREVAKLVAKYGFEARRGQQFAGGTDSPDVVHDIPGVHIEVKRAEQFNFKAAMDQAERDRKDAEVPVVFHRKNSDPWFVVMYAEDFLFMMQQRDKGK